MGEKVVILVKSSYHVCYFFSVYLLYNLFFNTLFLSNKNNKKHIYEERGVVMIA